MNQLSHDYSKHTLDELGYEVSTLDARACPERAAGLYQELHKRLILALDDAKRVHSDRALVVGARFDQLDGSSRRRFFWPYLGVNAAFAIVYSFATALVAIVIAAVIIAVRRRSGLDGSDPTRIVQLVLSLILLVPVATWWLEQVTKRTFGGYCLRIFPKRE